MHNGARVKQVRVKWVGLGDGEASWSFLEVLQNQLPDLSLVIRAVSGWAAIDRPNLLAYMCRGARPN